MEWKRDTSLMLCSSVRVNTFCHHCPCRTSQVGTTLPISILASRFSRDISIPLSSAGHETFTGTCIHSRDYKDGSAFAEKRVMVVGIGNSGGDIASEISRHAAKVRWVEEMRRWCILRQMFDKFFLFFSISVQQTFLSTRKGAWVIGRLSERGIPMDLIMLNRFNRLLLGVLPRSVVNWVAEKRLNDHCDHRFYGLQPAHR